MLEQARRAWATAPRYVVADLGDPLPEGPWDAVVSALAIHHLDDPGKRALFARVRAARSPPGGVFVNAEQVAGETPWLDAVYVERHERAARALGATDAEWAAATQRMSHDVCATVDDQLAWLREAGFADAGALARRAVRGARRAGGDLNGVIEGRESAAAGAWAAPRRVGDRPASGVSS